MKNFNLYEKYDKPIYINLGFFDCIHAGHESLIKESIHYASKQKDKVETAVLTFSNDPNLIFNGTKQIYSITERTEVLKGLGVDNLITVDFDDKFSKLKPDEFLDILTNNFNIKAIFCGCDYTYGHKAEGNIDSLYVYCKSKNIDLIVLPFVIMNERKISTRDLKQYVIDGNIDVINKYLTEEYFIIGKVNHGKHNGSKLGFPTVNIESNEDILPIGEGVYATIISIDSVDFQSMTNVGKKPTFGDDSRTIETNIFDFDEDLYGKEVKLSFFEKIRDIKKFDNIEDLKNQLKQDKEIVQIILKVNL